jgi:hypothetical protein
VGPPLQGRLRFEQSCDREAAKQDQRNENEAPSDEEMSEFDSAHL